MLIFSHYESMGGKIVKLFKLYCYLTHLDYLHHPDQTDGESDQDQDDGEEGQHVSEHSRALLAGSLVACRAEQVSFFSQKLNFYSDFFFNK